MNLMTNTALTTPIAWRLWPRVLSDGEGAQPPAGACLIAVMGTALVSITEGLSHGDFSAFEGPIEAGLALVNCV